MVLSVYQTGGALYILKKLYLHFGILLFSLSELQILLCRILHLHAHRSHGFGQLHYPKPVKYYTIDISRYGQDVVVAYRRDVELTKPMRAMIMQMKDAAEEYLKL